MGRGGITYALSSEILLSEKVILMYLSEGIHSSFLKNHTPTSRINSRGRQGVVRTWTVSCFVLVQTNQLPEYHNPFVRYSPPLDVHTRHHGADAGLAAYLGTCLLHGIFTRVGVAKCHREHGLRHNAHDVNLAWRRIYSQQW